MGERCLFHSNVNAILNNSRISGKYKTDIISMCLTHSCSLYSMITLKYSTQAFSRLVCAYTLSCHTSGTSAGREGGGVHTSHIVKTLVSVELTSVLRLARATSYNTRACVIAGGSRHSINTSTCTWQRYATLRLQTYNILVPFCRLFHVI